MQKQEVQIKNLLTEVDKLRVVSSEAEKSSNKVTELEEEIKRLRKELEQERGEKKDLVSEKELIQKKYVEVC